MDLPVWGQIVLSLFTGLSLVGCGVAWAFRPLWTWVPITLTLLGIWLLNVL